MALVDNSNRLYNRCDCNRKRRIDGERLLAAVRSCLGRIEVSNDPSVRNAAIQLQREANRAVTFVDD